MLHSRRIVRCIALQNLRFRSRVFVMIAWTVFFSQLGKPPLIWFHVADGPCIFYGWVEHTRTQLFFFFQKIKRLGILLTSVLYNLTISFEDCERWRLPVQFWPCVWPDTALYSVFEAQGTEIRILGSWHGNDF